MSKKIAYVSVHLDEDVPEYMNGVVRCGSVVSQDADGNDLQDHQELIDNAEFRSESELVRYVATKLGVSEDIVEVEA